MADNVEIQGLEFQIQENSAGAVTGLNNLKKALSGLKTVSVGSANNLSKTATGIRESVPYTHLTLPTKSSV